MSKEILKAASVAESDTVESDLLDIIKENETETSKQQKPEEKEVEQKPVEQSIVESGEKPTEEPEQVDAVADVPVNPFDGRGLPSIDFDWDAYEFHKLCLIVPPKSQAENASMLESLRTVGQQQNIKAFKAKPEDAPVKFWIIDGRHKFNCLRELNVKPKIDILENDAEIHEVMMTLLFEQRNLKESQRAMIAAEIIQDKDKISFGSEKETGRIRDRIAKQVNASSRLVGNALRVCRTTEPEVREKVRTGVIALNEALKFCDLPREKQIALAAIEKKTHRVTSFAQIAEQIRNKKLKKRQREAANKLGKVIEQDSGFGLVKAIDEVPDKSIDWIIARLSMPTEKYEDLFDNAIRILKDGGSIAALVNKENVLQVADMLNDTGLKLSTIIHCSMPKNKPCKSFDSTFERWLPCLWFSKGAYKNKAASDSVNYTDKDILEEDKNWNDSSLSLAPIARSVVDKEQVVLEPNFANDTLLDTCKELGAKLIGIKNGK